MFVGCDRIISQAQERATPVAADVAPNGVRNLLHRQRYKHFTHPKLNRTKQHWYNQEETTDEHG
jgi:hypothetical protein